MEVTSHMHLRILKKIEEHLETLKEKSQLERTKGFYSYATICKGRDLNQFAPSFIAEFGCLEGERCDHRAGIMLTLNDIVTKTMWGYPPSNDLSDKRRLALIGKGVNAPIVCMQIGDSLFCMTHLPWEACSAILLAIAWEFGLYPAHADYTEKQAFNEFFTEFKLLDRKFFEALNVANPCTFASAVVQNA